MNTWTLSPEQRAAIEHDGALLVLAGAGSGKTTVLAERLAQRIQAGKADPYRTLAVTFSVRAAQALRERLCARLDPAQVGLMTVATLHALGLRLLREHGEVLGYVDPAQGVVDDLDAASSTRRLPTLQPQAACRALLARLQPEVVESLRSSGRAALATTLARMSVDDVQARISAAKAAGLMPSDAAAATASGDLTAAAAAAVYAAYQAELLAHARVDFDDLILQPLRLLDPAQSGEVAAMLRERFSEIACDEFQDTSAAQYALLRRLVGPGATLTVIGDPEQCVYAFRGALGETGFAQVERDFPHACVIALSRNYRSSAPIVRAGAAVLGRATPLDSLPVGAPVALVRAGSEHDEAEAIAGAIATAVAAEAVRYDQCAVICRTNAQIAPLERALLRRQLPYTVLKRGGFFDQPEIRQLSAYLSLAIDTADHYAFRQIVNTPPRGLGPAAQALLKADDPELTIDAALFPERVALLDAAAQAGLQRLLAHDLSGLVRLRERPPGEALAFVLADAAAATSASDAASVGGIGLRAHVARQNDGRARLERVALYERMAQGHSTIRAFLDELDAMSGQDPVAPGGHDRVQILTAHDAKGLEFDLVFVAGLEEGLFPHYHAASTAQGLRDERRLCYVGVTRARRALVLTYARTRNGRPVLPSRFLRSLPADCVSRQMPAWATLLPTN